MKKETLRLPEYGLIIEANRKTEHQGKPKYSITKTVASCTTYRNSESSLCAYKFAAH